MSIHDPDVDSVLDHTDADDGASEFSSAGAQSDSGSRSVGVDPQGFISRGVDLGIPIELMARIFSDLPFKGRISSSHVCTYWRQVSLLFTSLLWSNITWSSLKLDVLVQLLERAGTTPVRLQLTVVDEDPGLPSLISAHMHHVRHLWLLIDIGYTSSSTFTGDIAMSLCTPAPVLETAVLWTVHPDFSPDLLAEKNMALFPNAWRSAGLQSLLLSPTLMKATDLRNFFALIPRLPELGLEISDQHSWIDEYDGIRIPLPPTLQALVLIISSPSVDPLAVLKRLDIPQSIMHTCIPFKQPKYTLLEITDAVLAWIFVRQGVSGHGVLLDAHDPIVSIEVDSSNYSNDHAIVECTTATGRRVDAVDISLHFQFKGSRSALKTLKSLTISVGEWISGGWDSWPDAPVLTEITLRLILARYMKQDAFARDILLDPRSTGGRLCCPRLKTLTFSTRPPTNAAHCGFIPTLAPETIRERAPADYPLELYLNGIRLLPNNVPEVARLLAIFDTIDFGPGHTLNPNHELTHLLNW
ncbi:hypothetical protein BKA62DRAFT_822428 [Auriculariales sp. MPI-PUGE-AT-0066]|nr:hypothetical protein BKA62DRAFT_822428 [Auriculariales sp. MPI-PUGE-AT-0066]